MATVKLSSAGSSLGGVIQGNYGIYTIGSDGTVLVDARDAPPLLAQGLNYVNVFNSTYTLPKAPAAASAGAVVSSVALSNGTLSIAASPDVMRPVIVEVFNGTGPITAGTLAVTYVANDGTTQNDNISLVCGASTSATTALSKGVLTVSSATVSGLVGGTSPGIRLSTIAAVSLPVGPNAVDFAVTREYDAGATVAVGTVYAASLASITPTTAPNGTVTYSFVYGTVGADT